MALGLGLVEFLNCYRPINFQNFMILILHILDFENEEHTKYEFNWYTSFQD